jgi:hypothetical protein
MAVGRFHAEQRAVLDPAWRYSDWTEEHRNLFTAIHIEKIPCRTTRYGLSSTGLLQ